MSPGPLNPARRMQYGGGRSILEFLMNATRFTILGALAASLLMVPACDDKKADGKTDAKAKTDPKDDKADDKKAEDKDDAKAEAKPEDAKPAEAAAEGGAEAAAEASIGVAVCDEYITKYGACIKEHAPEAMRTQMTDALAKSAERFKTQSAGPEKDSLEQACTAALDAVKKTSKGWGCTYE